ncbi:MAG TPA: glycosyltransferase family 4 protein [Ignavibacteriaceae bacterium]|nr:glycosyltransferase family 4 protein [Ignavibacteriaceae bacterium]
MRILQIAPQIPVPPTDGGKIGIYGITKGLQARGHQIDFVCYRKHDSFEYSFKELRKICTPHILNVQTDNNILGVLKNSFSPVPYNISKYIKNEMSEFLADFFRLNKVDIVHVDHLHLGWVIDEIRNITSVPVCIRGHNLEMQIMKRFYEKQKNIFVREFARKQYKKFIKYEPELMSKFDRCIMISNKDEQTLVNMKPGIKTSVISAGVDKKLLEIKRDKIKPHSIIHIGHTDWFPNYDGLEWFISNCLPEIVKKYPDTNLYIYGGGKTKDFPVPDSLKNNITVVGFVEDLWTEIKDKALAIVPLRIGGGIRIKIIEMLASGQPIVTTSIGKEGLNLEDKKHLLVADSKEEFISKITDYFEGRYDIEKIKAAGRNYIRKNFTWEIISEQFEEIYKNLLISGS